MMPEDVRKAVDALCWLADQAGRYVKPTNDEAVATITAHLLAREAEVAGYRLNEQRHIAQAVELQARCERAEALLRECVAAHTGENIEGCDMSDADVARITAHLSENSRG